jgi:hypothetical protein
MPVGRFSRPGIGVCLIHSNCSGTFAMKPVHLFLSVVSLAIGAAAMAQESPVFNGSTVTIPRIDSPGQAGLFQDVVLNYTAQGLTVLQLEHLGLGKVYNLGQIEKVEVKKTGTVPASVYLQLSGTAGACDFTGPARAHQRLQGSKFEVNVSAPHLYPVSAVQVCPANIRPFRVTVPLQVYGLAAGTYSYAVNGITGSFTLEADNKFADDCDVTRFGSC